MSNKFRDDWDDMEDLISIRERINNLFQHVQERSTPVGSDQSYGWTPSFDIFETDQEYVVKAEVPGVKEQDLSVQVHNNILSVRGERKPRKDADREYYHLMERSHGRFVRSFTLPEPVNEKEIQAALKDGILTVTVPKTGQPEVKPEVKKVAVRSGG